MLKRRREDPEGAGDETARFRRLMCGPCPPLDEILLALAAAFRPVRRDRALDRLDELGRMLFGLAGAPVDERCVAVAHALADDHGLHVGRPDDVDCFMLDLVLERRRGHPALLAVLYAEAARRAGIAMSVFSSRDAWLVGERQGDSAVLLDPAGRQAGRVGEDPLEVRPHCAHELAYALLEGLRHRFESSGDRQQARRARQLAHSLPVVRDLRSVAEDRPDPRG